MEQKLNPLEFDQQGNAVIGLDQLEATISLGEFDGKMPKSVPQVHHQLINNLLNIASIAGSSVLQPITIREKYCKKRKDATNCDPENYMVNRLAAKILFPEQFMDGNDAMRAGIALTYVYDGSQRGIQVAYGMNVNACDNLTVWGRYSFSTNGNTSTPFEKGMELLEKWVREHSVIAQEYMEKIKLLQDYTFDQDKIDRLVGNLFSHAVRKNYGQNVEAPLNQTEVADMIRKGFGVQLPEHVNAWDVLNWGTYVLKPTASDMTDYVGSNAKFADHILEFCGIN